MLPGPIILDLHGLEVTPEDREILQHPQVGGIILFTRNYDSPTQIEELCKQVQVAAHTQLLITVDHEGGRVQRFREGFSALPALGKIGLLYNSEPARAKQLAEAAAWLMASELLAVGVDLSFAPVLDLDKGVSEVIGDRSFHRDPEIVTELAEAYIQGLQRAGMGAIGKHFPGHGSVAVDSHIAIPIDERSYEEIESDDLIPFARLVSKGLSGVMPAHVIYKQVEDLPAGFSQFWLQRVLREQLNFDGIIFSDDLTMAGAHVVGDVTERAKLALAAGCDSLLVCNDRSSAISVIEYLERNHAKKDPQRAQRLIKLYNRGTLKRDELQKTTEWKTAINLIERIN